jgi:hypothetical protein
VKAFDAEENDPNFATIYSGDGGWRGIEAGSDSAINVTAGLGNALRHAPIADHARNGARDCRRLRCGVGEEPKRMAIARLRY